MTILDAAILGLLQGLTEFIPVSSSGHLVLGQHFLGLAPDHLFVEWINIGTLLALVIYFWRRLWGIARAVVQQSDYRLAGNILITALPAGLAGLLLARVIESASFFSSVGVVTAALAIVGAVMILLPRLPHLAPVATAAALPWGRALTIGLAQMLALVPGVSRSGSTIITGRLMGLGAREAAEYSFLVSIPIMAGVVLKLLASHNDRAYLTANFVPLLVGNLVAFVSGLLAVGLLLRYLERHGLELFGWYRLGLALVVVIALTMK